MFLMYFIIVLSAKVNLAHKDTIPVFLIDHEGVMDHLFVNTNPFIKTSTTYFANVVREAIKLSEVVILFVEELFCIEDVSTKDKLGTPYLHLRKGIQESKVKYFPGVVEPYKLLYQVFRPQQFNVYHLSSGAKLQTFDGRFKYIYVFFHDGVNETRAEMLRRHDLIMTEVYFVVRQLANGPVLAFYTGKVNPVEIEKLYFFPISPSPPARNGVTIETDGALFRFTEVYMATQTRRATFNQLPAVTDETWTREKLVTKMAYTDFDLLFNFSFQKDGWLLESVALLEGGEEVGRTEMAVGAPWRWAYYCGEPLVLLNSRDGSAVTIEQYKIQPFKSDLCYPGEDCYKQPLRRWSTTRSMRNLARIYDNNSQGPVIARGGDKIPSDESKGFGKTVNCGPYFNIHILSAFFITGICLIVLIYGVVSLYNCASNDRFDDPYGRPLVMTDQH
ncbi:uncharacterized protein LOC131850274 [Achroia grisella]|uniref:uncharacterized protein LOC131850274 n=1 Tax=Achroia grisella TaxID=688607 RepID=UPI0027D342F8|nr:uncharacterized protein LOC131850274 [Achroia grisella]